MQSNGFSYTPKSLPSREKPAQSSADHSTKEQQAFALINQGKLQDAEAIYRELIAAGTRNHIVYGNFAALCGIQERFDELIDLLIKIAKFSNKSCPVFNLGSDKPISIWGLSKLVSKNYKLDFLYPRQNNNKFDFYVPNIDKLKKIFNFRQKFDLKKSISYTLETIKELK